VRSPRPAWARRWREEATADQILQGILAVDGGQPCDRPAAAGDNHLATPLNTLEMLAQPIVELANPNLVSLSM
jgi:hypothetical protein